MISVDGNLLPWYYEFPKNEWPGHAELDAEMDEAIARDDYKDRIVCPCHLSPSLPSLFLAPDGPLGLWTVDSTS